MLVERFPAMGTTITVFLDVPPGPTAAAVLTRAREAVLDVHARCSRFDPRSELSRLNAAGSGRVSSLLADVVRLALDARRRTGGRVDPTVHDAVVAAGYDRTFDDVGQAVAGPSATCGGAVSLAGDHVVLGPGVRLDLGGIAKGFAADRASALLAAVGPSLVDAGGDIAVRGTWPVGLEDGPTVELTDVGIATSGRDRRSWETDAGPAHHLIDPRTGRPALTQTLRATVVAPTTVEAEVLAKAAFLGMEVAAPHVLVLDDGRRLATGGLA